jgi:hypothetical protein
MLVFLWQDNSDFVPTSPGAAQTLEVSVPQAATSSACDSRKMLNAKQPHDDHLSMSDVPSNPEW